MSVVTRKIEGVCAKDVTFEIIEGHVRNVKFTRGCNGNLQGIAALIEGMEVSEVIKKLKGISCDGKDTSCPDQLALLLEEKIVLETSK